MRSKRQLSDSLQRHLKWALFLCVGMALFISMDQPSYLKIAKEKGEYWWIGIVTHGQLQPIQNGYEANLIGNCYGNQAQPLLLSNTGKIIWSDGPFQIKVSNDSIILSKPSGNFLFKKAGNNLKEAYQYASNTFFPPSGLMPEGIMFQKPQYNTWIELLYNQNQKDILKYATSIINNGLPPGAIMIDDNWQEDYGKWTFHPDRFPDPKLMMDSLHNMGFKVMLWVCPFVSPDSETGRMLEKKSAFLNSSSGETQIIHWWNGYSAVLDLSNEFAMSWFKSQLNLLMSEYHVDGFKFDAGDPEYYIKGVSSKPTDANQHSELYAKLGLDYQLNEYRACWKMGGQPLAQRLRDKGHSWKDLQTLLPHIFLQGIMGYPFTCPDMIGGGEMGSFTNLEEIDQDLIVRSAQCQVFMPMMQFSVAPWRVLDEEHYLAVKKAVDIRASYTGLIMDLARTASTTGEPVVRYMEYEFPGENYENITDQFMLGNTMLIAPFLDNSASRKVVVPKGKWKDDEGNIIQGPRIITVKSELSRIPYYKKLDRITSLK